MPTRLTGIPALSYMGVEAPQPPNITFHPRAPLKSDYQNFNTGDLWVDTSNFPPNPPTAENIWMLVSKQGRLGIWVNFSSAAGDLDSLTGDTGGPVFGDANQNINILSAIPGLTVDGNPATNTLTLNWQTPPIPPVNSFIHTTLSVNQNNLTGDGTIVNPVIFDQVVTDFNGDYNPLTGIFTVPVTGIYSITSFLLLNGLTASHTTGTLRIVGSNTARGSRGGTSGNYATFRNAINEERIGGNSVFYLEQGDTIQITLQVNNGGLTVGIIGEGASGNPARTFFDVALIRELNGGGGIQFFQGLAADDSPPNVFPDANGIINIEGTVGNITTAQDAVNNAIILNTGGGVALEYTTDDANSAEPFNRNLNVLGGGIVSTSTPIPGGDTITINAVDAPAICHFFAYINQRINNVTGDGTLYSPIIYDTEDFDIGGDFNLATGVFTAPVDGVYMFSASVRYLKGSTTLTRMRTRFQTATQNYSIWSHADTITPGNTFLGIAEWYGSNTLIIVLNAGETVQTGIQGDGSALTVSLEGFAQGGGLANRFSGYLVARL